MNCLGELKKKFLDLSQDSEKLFTIVRENDILTLISELKSFPKKFTYGKMSKKNVF